MPGRREKKVDKGKQKMSGDDAPYGWRAGIGYYGHGANYAAPPPVPPPQMYGFYPPPTYGGGYYGMPMPMMGGPPPMWPVCGAAGPAPDSSGKVDALPAQSFPGGLMAGMNYLYPANLIKFHWFPGKGKEMADGKRHPDAQFNILTCDANWSCNDLVEAMGMENGKTSIMEIHEVGGGRWRAGKVVKGDDGEAMKKPVGKWGWTSKRGGPDHPPLWLVGFKVDVKK